VLDEDYTFRNNDGGAQPVPLAIAMESLQVARPARCTQHRVVLDDAGADALRAFGGGNLSAGVRRAALRLVAAGFPPLGTM